VVLGERPGQEIEYPLAIVILGGLLTSTLLSLFVIPSLYLRFGKSRRELAEAGQDGDGGAPLSRKEPTPSPA
jgi:Cu/Ag efflux pump CusA